MKDIGRFFVTDVKNDCVTFTGDKLECFIPIRYKVQNFLKIGSKIEAFGIFSMRVNDDPELNGFQLPAIISIDPVETYEVTMNEEAYFVCVLRKGSKFMTTLSMMQLSQAGFFMWNEFVSVGHMPEYMTYDYAAILFDDLGPISGSKLNADHSILEMILAHIYRDPQDLNTFYRYSTSREKPQLINLRDVAYGAQTTHSRILGSYSETGYNSALLNTSKENHPLEDLFRM